MLLYTVTWIPSIYPSHFSIYTIHESYGIYLFNIVIYSLIFSFLQINVFAGVTRVIFMSMWLRVSLLIIANLIVVSLVFGKYLQSIQMFATSYFFYRSCHAAVMTATMFATASWFVWSLTSPAHALGSGSLWAPWQVWWGCHEIHPVISHGKQPICSWFT